MQGVKQQAVAAQTEALRVSRAVSTPSRREGAESYQGKGDVRSVGYRLPKSYKQLHGTVRCIRLSGSNMKEEIVQVAAARKQIMR